MSDDFHPDPLGKDRRAAIIVGIALGLSLIITWWNHGFSTDPYQWVDSAFLPLWADLLITVIFVPIVCYGMFVFLAALLRVGEGDEDTEPGGVGE